MAHKVNTAANEAGCYHADPRQVFVPSMSFFRGAITVLFMPGLLLAAGCAHDPRSAQPSVDAQLLVGETALLRGRFNVASEQYAAAARRTGNAEIARRATQIAFLAGDDAAAGEAVDRWQALAPGDSETARFQAVLHARAGEPEVALSHLRRAVGDGSQASKSAALQSVTLLLAGEDNVWRAADLMARLAAEYPDIAAGWHGAAKLALEADRAAIAEQFAGGALALAPDTVDARFLQARARLRDRGQAETVLQPLAGFADADDPGLRYRYAMLLSLAGRVAEADALLEDILLRDPDQLDARLARALLAMEAGNNELARRELRALQDAGIPVDASLGLLAEREGRLHVAVEHYAAVPPDSPDWLQAQVAIGSILLALDGPTAVAGFFDALRADWPDRSPALLLQQAVVLTSGGRPAAARQLLLDRGAELEAANLADERDWQLGVAAAEAGDLALAERALKRLLERDPGHVLVQNALGYVLLERDRPDEAAPLIESALAAAPANADILDSAGWLRFLQGEPEQALQLLEESWWRQPAPMTGLHVLAVLETLGRHAEADDFAERLRRRFPDSEL